jgi:hypothetical protein
MPYCWSNGKISTLKEAQILHTIVMHLYISSKCTLTHGAEVVNYFLFFMAFGKMEKTSSNFSISPNLNPIC